MPGFPVDGHIYIVLESECDMVKYFMSRLIYFHRASPLIAPCTLCVHSILTLSVHCDNTFMGSWNGMNSGSICMRDRWTSHGISHCPMGTVGWDGQ